MSDDRQPEEDFVTAAYAEKVKEAFIVFADNLGVGQSEKACRERFLRTLQMVKKARDLALQAMRQGDLAEASEERPTQPAPGEGLSEEDRALIEAALSGTTGVAKPVRFR